MFLLLLVINDLVVVFICRAWQPFIMCALPCFCLIKGNLLKTKTKIKTGDESEIKKVNRILVLMEIADTLHSIMVAFIWRISRTFVHTKPHYYLHVCCR